MMVRGSVQSKKGKLYVVLRIKNGTDDWQTKWISTGLPEKGNKRKVEREMLPTLIAEYSDADGSYVEPAKLLFCDFMFSWVEIQQPKLQVTTHAGYLDMLNKHICPYFKAKKLQLTDVSPDSIQRYYSVKIKEGLSPNTVVKHHAIIRSALKYAVKTRLIKENPCDFVDRPKIKKYKGEFYNADEIKHLLDVTKGTTLEVPVFIAAYFGLRRSEVLGVRWSSIDFSKGQLAVCHKVVKVVKDGKVARVASDELKTESSYRVLPLDDNLLEFFSEVKKQQEQNKSVCGNSYNTQYEDYVCVNAMGELLNPDYISGTFGKIIKRNGLKSIRYHDLRHSCASLLLALGYSMKEVQEWLGHSNYLTTANLYSHIDPKNKKDMIRGLSGALSNT